MYLRVKPQSEITQNFSEISTTPRIAECSFYSCTRCVRYWTQVFTLKRAKTLKLQNYNSNRTAHIKRDIASSIWFEPVISVSVKRQSNFWQIELYSILHCLQKKRKEIANTTMCCNICRNRSSFMGTWTSTLSATASPWNVFEQGLSLEPVELQ